MKINPFFQVFDDLELSVGRGGCLTITNVQFIPLRDFINSVESGGISGGEGSFTICDDQFRAQSGNFLTVESIVQFFNYNQLPEWVAGVIILYDKG